MTKGNVAITYCLREQVQVSPLTQKGDLGVLGISGTAEVIKPSLFTTQSSTALIPTYFCHMCDEQVLQEATQGMHIAGVICE